MANLLTGDFDAVAQVSVPTVNRLLASMHQNHGNEGGLPTLPHRDVVRIGDEPLGGSLAGIKGTAYVQIGVPTVALVANAPRSAETSCWIRARYYPDPKTTSLPEFIHGRIVARFDVTETKFYGVSVGLRATASSDDARITFTDSELNLADSQKVTGLVRNFLRTRVNAFLSLLPDIPPGTFDLQGLTDGQGRQAVALPITLAGTAPSPGGLGQVFLDNSDFAIAVSKQFILALMQPAIDALNQAKLQFSITVTVGGWMFKFSTTAHYTVSMTATAAWKDGALTVSVTGTAETPHPLFPNAGFAVSQSFTFPLDASSQSITITPSGEPKIDIDVGGPFGSLVEGKAEKALMDRFVLARDGALQAANDKIKPELAKQRDQVSKLLRKIDDGAEVTIVSAPPDDNGVLLRGNVSLSPRNQPRVEFSELGDGSGYTAFDTWVPGGRVRYFRWTWWHAHDYDPETLTVAVHETSPKLLVDRFVLREKNLPGMTPPGAIGPTTASVALSQEEIASMIGLEGTGILIPRDGQLCLAIGYEQVDRHTGQMVIGSAEEVLHPGISCHSVTVNIKIPVYYKEKEFTDWPCPGWNVIVVQPAESELVSGSEVLLQAIPRAERPDAPVMLLLAVRIGRRGPGRALAVRARELRQRFPQLAVVLADRDAHWLRRLDLPSDESRLALRLVDTAGRLVWRHDGAADATAIVAALHEHLVAGPPPRGGLLEARVRPGNRAPDFSFEAAPGDRIALSHLRGRRLAVLFVSEGHAALEAAVRLLSSQAGETDEPRMVVIIVHDEEAGDAAPTPHSPNFDWVVVADPQRAITRSYGIAIRPTAVLIDRDGLVSTVGVMPTAIETPRRTSASYGAGLA